MNRKKLFRSSLLLFFFVTILGLICFGSKIESRGAEDEGFKDLRVFTDALDYIQKNYVEETEMKDMIYGAINGMLRSLDPHSSFMTPDLFKEMQVETSGQFGGLGIEITIKNRILTVVSPIEDTPAYKIGIKSGDRIIEIEGESTLDINLIEAVKKLRGQKGTKVTITIMRDEFEDPKEFTITRDIIKIKSVKSRMLEDGYGYIRITQFRDKTSSELEKTLNEMETKEPGLKGLVLDLRNNPGGLLEQAVEVSDKFLSGGLIVSMKGRNIEQKKFYAKKSTAHTNFMVVVLVNEGSASASEIVAGALQHHGRALILGAPTFGKGSVQTIVPLRDKSALRLTTALYYTPGGISIQAKGIEPDIKIDLQEMIALAKLPEEEEKKRTRVREIDLKGHFEVKEKEVDSVTSTKEKEVDPLIRRALELMKSWDIFKETVKK